MLKTVQNSFEKFKLKSGKIIWSFNMVEGLFFNSSKQNLNATFFILFIIPFSTGYQQEFVNCWKLFSYYKDASFLSSMTCSQLFLRSLVATLCRDDNASVFTYLSFRYVVRRVVEGFAQKNLFSFAVVVDA